jgi:hypothetical protein
MISVEFQFLLPVFDRDSDILNPVELIGTSPFGERLIRQLVEEVILVIFYDRLWQKFLADYSAGGGRSLLRCWVEKYSADMVRVVSQVEIVLVEQSQRCLRIGDGALRRLGCCINK